MRDRHEKDVPAQPDPAQTPPRISRAQGDQGRPSGARTPSGQGPQTAVGLTAVARPAAGRLDTLKKRADFLALKNAPKTGARAFLLVRKNREDGSERVRIGLTVTRKLGGAVIRNRIKRRLRAVAREVFPQFAEPGCDYAIIARPPARTQNYADLLDDMKRALLRLARSPT